MDTQDFRPGILYQAIRALVSRFLAGFSLVEYPPKNDKLSL
jgi:hypothetical protein